MVVDGDLLALDEIQLPGAQRQVIAQLLQILEAELVQVEVERAPAGMLQSPGSNGNGMIAVEQVAVDGGEACHDPEHVQQDVVADVGGAQMQ